MEQNFSYLELMAALQPPDPEGRNRIMDADHVKFTPHIPFFQPEYIFNEPEEVLRSPERCREQFTEPAIDVESPGSSVPLPDELHSDAYLNQPVEESYDGSSSDTEGSADDSYEIPFVVPSDEDNDDAHDFTFMLPLEESDSEGVIPNVGSDIPAEGVAPVRPEGSPETCTTPYKKRNRTKKGDFLPDGRESNSIGPIEIAIRSSYDRKDEHIFLPKVGTSFDTAAEAYEFYNLYSWEKGFGINYGRSDTNRGNKYKTMQELQCTSEGRDSRIVHQSQRCGCKAKIWLLRSQDHGWYITRFIEQHNHVLSDSCGEKMQWNSHRRIDECAKNMIKHLRDNNVPLGKLAKEQMDDDVKKTLQIFRQMRKEDPDFAYSVDVDKHNRIKTLIWTNHRSKMQYHCFGDVFTFDTTYCTNIYKMPFGLFVGVNNHFQSVIYAGVLMRHETIKAFTWVFNEFLTLMGGKAPITILTDQAPAMIPAIEKSMPNTTHLWCKWHVLRKAQESLGPVYSKSSAFRQEFHKVLNEMLTIDEFEAAWTFLINKYKLTKNPFMIKIYECRVKWAKPFSKKKFCARMMSTQRGESANHMLKTYIRGNSTMNNFVSKYNDMMFDRAMEEDTEEHKTKMVKKPSGRMWPIQSHAYKIYTRASFKLFTTELEKSYHFTVAHDNNSSIYQVNHAYSDLREPWVRVKFNITVCQLSGEYDCECGLFTHFRILCCHSIRVMNYLGVAKIPLRYVLKRWTRDARDILPENLRFLQKDNRAMKSHTFRDNLLYLTAMKAVKAANQDEETFNEMMKHFRNGIKGVEGIVAARGATIPDEEQPIYESSDNEWHRAHTAGYQSEPGLATNGKTLYSDDRIGAVPSKFDLANVKAPVQPKKSSGRKRFKRFLSPVEKKSKRTKKSSTAKPRGPRDFKQSTFCSFCKLSGHRRNTCPVNPEAGKTKRRAPCCSTCHLPGHKSNMCHLITPNVDEFDISDLREQSEEE